MRLAAAAAVVAIAGCAVRPGAPICARDALVGPGGRCACAPGRALFLGACIAPALADAICGPAARFEGGRCAFRACGPGEVLDIDGPCVPVASVQRGFTECHPGESLLVETARSACVPSDSACPRGAHFEVGRCQEALTCPAGSLREGDGCRAVVTAGAADARVVDVAAWALLVLGASGGPGSAELCRPLESHPAALGVSAGDVKAVGVRIHLEVPGGDVSRVYAEVKARDRGAPQRPLPPGAPALVDDAVSSLVEALRGLGGEASTSALELDLTCRVAGSAGDAGEKRAPLTKP
jgi:hypothetical protein